MCGDKFVAHWTCMTANQLITQNCNFAVNFLVLSQTSPISLRESGKYIYADSSTCLQTIYPWTVFQDDKSQFDLETEQFYNIFEFLWHRLSNSFQLTQAQLKFNPNYGLLNVLSSVHHVQCVNIILTSKCRYCRPSSSQGNPRTLQFLYTIVTISYRNFMADSLIPSHSRRSLGRILFPAKTGVRQGCSLSLLLFIIVIDWVSRTAYSSSTGKQWTLASRF